MKVFFTDCADIVGASCNYFKEEKFYISTGAVCRDHINVDDIEKVNYDTKPSRANLMVEKGDVIFAKMQETKKALLVDDVISEYVYSTGFCAVHAKKGILKEKCLLYLVNSNPFLDQKDKNCSGATQKAITNSSLKKIIINIPEYNEQDKIVEKLDMLDSIIKIRKKELKVLDELIKARFVEMFGDPIFNPYGWPVVTVGDIVTDVRYGTSKPAVEGGKYPYLRMNNLTYDGYLNLSDMKYIDIPDNEIEKCIVRKGDVLFNRTNSIELVGKTCVFDLDDDMVIAGYIIRVRLNNKILPIVLSSYMNLPSLKEQLRSMAKGAVNQANINTQELQSIKIYLPPMELQEEFADVVKQVNKSKVKEMHI